MMQSYTTKLLETAVHIKQVIETLFFILLHFVVTHNSIFEKVTSLNFIIPAMYQLKTQINIIKNLEQYVLYKMFLSNES